MAHLWGANFSEAILIATLPLQTVVCQMLSLVFGVKWIRF